MKLFTISSSENLSKTVSQQLNISLSKTELITFGDTEVKPCIKENVRAETCIVIASTSPPVNDSYMEFFLLVDALRRSAAEKIIAVMPYFGYARQNQQHMKGEPVSAHVMVKFIEAIGVDELVTIDLHEEQLTGFFEIPINHISALPLLAKSTAENIRSANKDSKEVVVISPDQGGVERTRLFRDALSHHLGRPEGVEGSGSIIVSEDTALVEKRRNLENTHETKVMELTGDVKDKIAVIPDDVVVSGGTIVNAVKAVKDAGASSVYLCSTHADFIDGTVDKLKSAPIEKIIVTDTIEIKDKWKFEKLEVISVSELLSEEIKAYK